MPRLAIIIPGVDNVERLEATLLSVLENRPPDCEILVVLNRAYDDPYQLADEVRFVAARPEAGLVECANVGLAECRSPIVHLLGCGCEVSDGWTLAAMGHFRDAKVAAVAPVVVDRENRERIVAAGVAYGAGGTRRLIKRVPKKIKSRVVAAMLVAGFFRRAALQIVAGVSCEVGNKWADVDLALALRTAGYVTTIEPASIVVAGCEMPRSAGFRDALHAERSFWRNAPAMGWFSSLVCHPFAIAREAIASLPSPRAITQLAGRAAACLQMGNYPPHYQKMAELAHRYAPRSGREVCLPIERAPQAQSSQPQTHRAKAG